MAAYTETVKNTARRLIVEAAISILTRDRRSSTLARRSYVREAWSYLIRSDNPNDVVEAKKLSKIDVERWEAFYDSINQERTPANLKVAYLAGPNPENDLRVLCTAGVLPENIWAFESENATYSEAVGSALASEFPYIKIVNGGIDTFLEASHQRFDIIYLDFCGPLPSRNKKQKTLSALTRVLGRHALNSPGILVTNFSLPTEEQDPVGRKLIAKLVACYLYPKEFLEGKDGNTTPEGPIAEGIEPNDWYELVAKNLDEYYGQYITRVLMDHASFLSPYDGFRRHNSLFAKFFDTNSDNSLKAKVESLFHFAEDGGGGDVIVDAGQYPVLWTLAALDKRLNRKDQNYPQFVFEDEDFSKFAELFISQLSINGIKADLMDGISELSYLLSEGNGQENFLSKPIRRIHDRHDFKSFYQFCDLFLFHQSLDLLFRQVANPYHVNVDRTARWTYQAKDTPMFVDMLVLDECRYVYDWMPTADMFSAGISHIARQLSFRFALDGIAKHRRWYNPEYFYGTAVIDQHTENFEAKILRPREIIADDL